MFRPCQSWWTFRAPRRPDVEPRRYPKLRNAPIVEAVLDFRVMPSSGALERVLKPIKALGPTYPNASEFENVRFMVGVQQGAVHQSHAASPEGLRYQSADSRWVALFAQSGFTLSRLEPYATWDEFLGEARRVWIEYVATAQPQRVVRIGVRYINRLDLPIEDDFDLYLGAGPRVPTTMPQLVSGFFSQIMVPYSDLNASALVTLRHEGGRGPVVLDIDVMAEGLTYSPEDDSLWAKVHQFREIKNDAFFGSITEKLLERYL